MSDTLKDTIIFGRHPVVEALESGQALEKVYLLMGTRGPFEKEVRHLCKDRDIPMQVVPKERLNKFTRQNHQGVVALGSLVTYQSLDDLVPFWFEQGIAPLLILLDGVTDVRNVGAIARSAEVLGAHALVIPEKGGAVLGSDAVKTSAGALMRLPVCRVKSLVSTIESMQKYGFRLIATALKKSVPLHEADMKGPLMIAMGAEGLGLHPSITDRADVVVRIPQLGETDSLNVSVAAGIVLYEAIQQRM